MRNAVVIGATGSVGSLALDVLRRHPGEFRVAGLIAGRNAGRLAELAREFPEARLALGRDADPAAAARLAADPDGGGRFHAGPDGAFSLLEAVSPDVCVAAAGGTAGLELAFAAAARCRRLLLANKEVLVSAGRLFLDAAAAAGTEVLPIDSEHCAVWQCLAAGNGAAPERIHLTASGGPFRDWPAERLASVTPAEAVRHPVWRMGPKISVDSATLANKALEVIEAHHLFNLPYDAIRVVAHPQAAVHGLAEFADGSLIACLGACDMRQPIAHMLFHPRRRENSLPRLSLTELGRLDFAEPDGERFPLLAAGIGAGRRGDRAAAFFNAADEAAVELFLAGRLSFPGLAETVLAALRESEDGGFASLPETLATHARARRLVQRLAESGTC